jgi:GT2 family glycosyltransferase
LLVVLNGDGRAEARTNLDGAGAPLRIVEQTEAGLSRARNRALEESTADVVVFLDDDARPAAGWLDRWREAFAPRALAAAGGPIELGWPSGRAPRWYHPTLDPYWSALDLGRDPGAAEEQPARARAFGANLAVDRQIALDLGGFDTRFGRGGTVADGGEESDLLLRLDRRGDSVGWVPAARVTHLVGEERSRLRWLVRRAHAQGVADRAFGALRPPATAPYLSGWATVTRAAIRAPRRVRATIAVDLARRARLLGRRRASG